MKNCIRIFVVLLIALVFSTNVFAVETIAKDKTFMSLVKDEVCDINFGTYASFEKKMVNLDKENKTIDISLTAVNNDPGGHKKTITVDDDVAGEVVLLIDLSYSMRNPNNAVDGVTRKKLVLDATSNLVDKLYTSKSDIDVGIVKFSTDPNNEGSMNDAQIVQELSSDKTLVKNKISSLYSDDADMGDRTDIEAGLKVSETLFNQDSDKKKFMVLLTDGLPNTVSNGISSEYSDATLNPTVTELASLEGKGINLTSLLIGVTNDNYVNPVITPQSYTFAQNVTYEQLANHIFGTASNPKYGPVYYVNTAGVTEAISNSIFKDLVPDSHTIEVDDTETYKLTDIVIKDYFPDYIYNNFDFSLLTRPSKGTVTETVDTTDKSITWTIPELAPKESTTFTYRLTLKDNVDVSILDMDLKTNKDVTIDYKEGGNQKQQVHNDKSPVVKLTTEVVPDPTPTPSPIKPTPKDDTVAPKPIPQTGAYGWLALGGLGSAGVISAIYWVIKSIRLDKKPQ